MELGKTLLREALCAGLAERAQLWDVRAGRDAVLRLAFAAVSSVGVIARNIGFSAGTGALQGYALLCRRCSAFYGNPATIVVRIRCGHHWSNGPAGKVRVDFGECRYASEYCRDRNEANHVLHCRKLPFITGPVEALFRRFVGAMTIEPSEPLSAMRLRHFGFVADRSIGQLGVQWRCEPAQRTLCEVSFHSEFVAMGEGKRGLLLWPGDFEAWSDLRNLQG
jgi:hypothetical protein